MKKSVKIRLFFDCCSARVGRGRLVGPICRHIGPEPPAAREVGALETALAKHTAGQVAAQSAVTVDVYGFRGIQFSHPIPQLIYGNVDSIRTDEALDGHFLGSAHIQQSDRAILWNGLHVRPVELGNGLHSGGSQ